METALRIKCHYDFTDFDVKNLLELKPIMERYAEEFPVEFYGYVKNFDKTAQFLKDDETIKRHQEGLKDWFMNLFDGDYGAQYLADLEHIGMTHVNINLSPHYVNAAMHFVKRYCVEIVQKEIEDRERRNPFILSVEKVLDINLDVITSSYIEEEKKKYFVSHKVENYLIQFTNRFSHGLNLVLVLGLVAMGVMVLGLFVYDFTHILDGDLEKGLLSTLGSLLMLWVVIELVDTEIEHLKGKKFAIKVFVSVALVAVIRKILVTTLKAEAVEAQMTLIIATAVLGVVYWLISKVEKD
ncbi:MAG: protoglobin domain-containing protein [Thermodesulfobacteriota bacterium]